MNASQLILLIRKIYEVGEKSVLFENKQTKCPVCEYLHIYEEGSVSVVTTRGSIRYCKCRKCGTAIKAVCTASKSKSKKSENSKVLKNQTSALKNIKKKNVSTLKNKKAENETGKITGRVNKTRSS